MPIFDTKPANDSAGLLTTPVVAHHQDHGPARHDAAGHRLANEFNGAYDTAFLTDAEQQQRTAAFDKGKMFTGGKAVDSKGGSSLNHGGEDRNIFAMTGAGDFVVADAGGEMDRLNGPWDLANLPDDFKRVHHSSLNQGQAVAAAGEMVVEDGQLTRMTDKSGHYMPKPQHTRQAVAGLDAAGVEMQRVQLELEKKGATPAVKGSALEILGYEAGATDIQQRMVAERQKKGGMLAEIRGLGADASVVANDQIVPSKLGKRGAQAAPDAPPLAPPPLVYQDVPPKAPPVYQNLEPKAPLVYKNVATQAPPVYKNLEKQDEPALAGLGMGAAGAAVADGAHGAAGAPGRLARLRNKIFGGLF